MIYFDYDDTLSEHTVQHFAELLVQAGMPVGIVTRRKCKDVPSNWNDDLYETAARIGIKEEHIHFMGETPKYLFFRGREDIHLDDDPEEVIQINTYTDTKAFHYVGYIDHLKEYLTLHNII